MLAAGLVPLSARTETPVEQAWQNHMADYAPIGIDLGGFRAFPGIGLAYSHSSNVYRTGQSEQPDQFATISPRLAVASEWDRHAVELKAGIDLYRYANLTSENRTDWSVEGTGRVDVTRPLRMLGSASYERRHEERGAPDAPGNAAKPTTYDLGSYSGKADYREGRFGIETSIALEMYDWQATPRIGLDPRSNDDRNRRDVMADIKVSYEFSPGYQIFARYENLSRRYEVDFDRNGYDRDLDSSSYEAGVMLEVTTLLIGEAFGGYSDYHFDKTAFEDLSTYIYGAQLRWYPTEMTSIQFSAQRSLDASTIVGVSGVLRSSGRVQLEHELLRNLRVTLSGNFARETFEGSSREDDVTGFGVQAKWELTREVGLQFFAQGTTRDSSVEAASFDDLSFGIRTDLRL